MAHSQSSFPAMTTSRDAPNPLRPYYVPPSIGLPPDVGIGAGASAATANSTAGGLGSSARDIFSEFDYGGPLFDADNTSVTDMAKKIMDQALWKYTSVLLAQPFDVAKTILQVRLAAAQQDGEDPSKQLGRRQSQRYSDAYYTEPSASENESEDDEPSYFTPTKPSRHAHEQSSRKSSSRRRGPSSRSDSRNPYPSPQHPHRLAIRRPDSIIDALSQLWQQSGATGLWKATNATFIYNVLVKAVESWTRSLLSALSDLPDPAALAGNPSEVVAGAIGGIDVADSPSPLASLAIAVASAAIAGLLLAPLDLVRTRLILTPISSQPRAIVPILRQLPSLAVPTSLLPATLLHSSLPTLITSSTPLILRQYLRIDPLTAPSTYSLATFLASCGELFLKLPLETVLRRGQVQVLRTQHTAAYNSARYNQLPPTTATSSPELETIVEPGPYRGVLGTMWYVASEEGVRDSGSRSVASTPAKGAVQTQRRQRKGQGVSGLWRGWRVGMWGLVGVWGASALGSGGKTEF
ncbi:hypothetical protein AAFC00_000582 [Neodothiora populina]|uniref:Mitochondrial fusion protein n=1 Tax=Neodothiora populina TaxID=2781224 RepID=A0ABR3PDC8_9PEZI